MNNSLYMVDYPRKPEFAEVAVFPVTYDYDKFVSCPRCGKRVSGAHWKQPREIVLTSRKTPDFLYAYCDNVPFLLSEAALDAITSAGLSGITCAEKIEFSRFQRKSKKETYVPSYYHIELERSQITVDHPHSIISYGKPNTRDACTLCRQIPSTYDFFRSLAFHMEFYEGYDIFQIYELGNQVFLSQRFVELCAQKGLTNLHYSPACKYGKWVAEYFLDGNEDA